MPDYKELYLQLMRATEKSIRILVEAQQSCEEEILREADQKQDESRT
ncbi:hypothetical protein [Dysosmobacter sp.]|nr:hypothetical protein [Dysosmobacter sp.]MCI6053916.1 hypothetical protein [Dysosmobacter sp.]MDY5511359.1 hypothetical protein [Dysosmobacter sp.]